MTHIKSTLTTAIPIALVASFATLGATGTRAGAINILADGTFNNADWTAAKVVDTTSGATATFAAAQVGSGGNPSAYRMTDMIYFQGTVEVSHLSTPSVYNPAASGAINSINYTYDLIETDPPFQGAQVGYFLLLSQGGTLYGSSQEDFVQAASWSTFGASGLTSADFGNVTATGFFGTSHPDFSASGAPIDFGYLTGNTAMSARTTATHSGIDNFSVTANTVPEPTAIGIATLAFLTLGMRRPQKWGKSAGVGSMRKP